MKTTLLCSLALGMAVSTLQANPEAIQNIQEPQGKPVTFSFGGTDNQDFMLDGKPFQIRGGEMHPQRIPRSHWQQRIRAAKAMGLNTIAFYIYWNALEQPDGSFSYEGMNDIAAFLKMCQDEKMWVLFRPGPYVCGEWDLGGLPSYLIKKPGAKLRTTQDADFIKASQRYLEEMARIAEPYLAKNGGPILMTQLENEYGSYNTPHTEKKYVEMLRDFWQKKGFAPLYTSDGSSAKHLRFTLPGVAIGLDPGTNDQHWKNANKAMPNVPVFSSETYPGWLRHWGEGNWAPSTGTINTVKWFMNNGRSFSLFVVHGGTNFGLTAGANANIKFPNKDRDSWVIFNFKPDITSYDYGSPIDEQGAATKEYHQYRDAISQKLPAGVKLPDVPATPPAMEIAAFTPERTGGIFDWTAALSKPVKAKNAPWFEDFGQNQGMAIYQVEVPAGEEAQLDIQYMNDFAMVYLDGKYVGSLDRTDRPNKKLKSNSITLPKRDKPARLDILVDTFGHINFSESMDFDKKGIYGDIKLGGKPLENWTVYPIPLDRKNMAEVLSSVKAGSARGDYKGSRFRAEVVISEEPKDTFLDMSNYSKGYVWVNGHNLGRYWNVGPQQRLFCPRDFLKKGTNVIDIVDLNMDAPAPIKGMLERNKEKGNIQTKNANNEW